MTLKRLSVTGIIAGAYLVAMAAPAAAHPVTGGDASPVQVAITIAGTAITLVGVAGAMVASGDSPVQRESHEASEGGAGCGSGGVPGVSLRTRPGRAEGAPV